VHNPIRCSCTPLSEEQLAAVETAIGFRLPQPYREFLLQHNGGLARRVTFAFQNKKGNTQEAWLGWIYSVGNEGKLDPADQELVAAFKERPSGLPRGILPVADAWYIGNDGAVCIACEGPDMGKVFFRPTVEPEKTTLYPVADSWPIFLENLEFKDGKEKKWLSAIQDGDAAAFREILERSKKWKKDGALRATIEQEAIHEGHWEIVELLLEKGWSTSELFHRALGTRRLELALLLLETGDVELQTLQSCLTEADGIIWHLPDFVEELVKRGADINDQNSMGETPLHSAVEARSLEGVRFLLDHGADPTVKNDDGRTPSLLAQRLEEPRLVTVLRKAEEEWNRRPAVNPQSLEITELDFHGIEMTETGPSLTLADIALFERETKIELPPAYRGFLLKANGGRPDPDRCRLPASFFDEEEDEDEDEDEEDRDGSLPSIHFAPLFPTVDEDSPPADDEPGIESVQEQLEYLKQTGLSRRMLAIGHVDDYGMGGGWLLLSCKGRDKGQLFYRDGNLETHEDGAWPLLDSLDALFLLLAEEKNRPPSPQDLAERAVKAGDLQALREALAAGASADRAVRSGLTLLRFAFDARQDEAAWVMLEAGADINEVFLEAVSLGRLALARRILTFGKGPSKNTLREAMTAHELYADPDLVKELLARGVDAKKKARAGKTPMQMMMVHGGWSPLHAACLTGDPESVRILLDAGMDINARTEEGVTPLTTAAGSQMGKKSVEVVKLLLERGAKVCQADSSGRTALHGAVERGDLETATLLIEAGEDLHARYELSIPGLSPEKQAKIARQSARALEELMTMFSKMGLGDEEDIPPIDTSTPLGEKLAQAQEAIEKQKEMIASRMGSLDERMTAMASGSMGKGPSAAESAQHRPEAQAILPQLEQIQARVNKSRRNEPRTQ
jgi:ankyrin repeat protein